MIFDKQQLMKNLKSILKNEWQADFRQNEKTYQTVIKISKIN